MVDVHGEIIDLIQGMRAELLPLPCGKSSTPRIVKQKISQTCNPSSLKFCL